MILLNWLPEMFLLGLVFVSLILINFKVLTHRSLSLVVSALSAICLCYFIIRQDLSFYESPLRILISDSLAYFGKLLSLATLVLFTLGFHFHRELNERSKQNSTLFLLFYSLFTAGMFQANSLVLYLGSALGLVLCSMNLIFIESNQHQNWIKLFRQRSLPIASWAIIMSLLFLLGSSLFGSIYLSDWIEAMPKSNASEMSLALFALLILLGNTIPLGGLMYLGTAPLGLGIHTYSLFLLLATFWLRLGVPFFAQTHLLSHFAARTLLSIILGAFSLRYAFQTMRTRNHFRWFAAAVPTALCLGLFLILLSGDHAMPAFYCIASALLLTVAFISHAFLDSQYRHKGMILFGTIALAGAPPLILGEQFYRLIHDAVSSDNILAGILMTLTWFILTVATTQMISRVLLTRTPVSAQRKLYFSEVFFFGIYLVCVIALTVFRFDIVALLNEHPLANLW